MFDAKSLIEMMVRGAAPQPTSHGAPSAQGGPGGLGDLLGQLGQMMQPGAAQSGAAQGGRAAPAGGAVPGLDDLLRQLGGAANSAGQSASDAGRQAGGGAIGGLGGLGDILGRIQQQAGAAMGGPGASNAQSGSGSGAGGAAPNIMDILGQVMGQATSGAREGAGKIGAATGATDALGKMMGGQSMDDVLAKLKELVAQNQFGAGAAAGGLGAVILGTQTGRSVAASAAKLGALALIGGLAYKAYVNYSQGKPLVSGLDTVAEAAPAGSGFKPQAVTNEAAMLYIRAMVAAAAADGRVDQAEMAAIMGNLKQAGLDAAAEEFMAGELNRPATPDELAAACQSSEQAVQLYTAARIAITPDSGAEKQFLATLADRLGMAPELAAHIDAAARSQA